jgi:hypothetical protein
VSRWSILSALAVLLGCAGAPARPGAGSVYRFPRAFEASQVVTLEAGGERREVLASLHRAGADYEVTLFEPVFSAPLLTASARGEALHEELLMPGPRPGDGTRLLALLRDVYGRAYPLDGAGRAEVRGELGRYELSGLAAAPAACPFPDRIEIAPRLGPRVAVRTVEVGCSAAPSLGGHP